MGDVGDQIDSHPVGLDLGGHVAHENQRPLEAVLRLTGRFPEVGRAVLRRLIQWLTQWRDQRMEVTILWHRFPDRHLPLETVLDGSLDCRQQFRVDGSNPAEAVARPPGATALPRVG